MKTLLLTSLCSILCLSSCSVGGNQNQTSSTVNSSPSLPPPTVQPTTAASPAGDGRSIADKIKGIVAKHLELKPNEVDVNTPFSKLKKPADELDVVEIIMTVEETFHIEIKDDELGGGDLNAVTNITVKQLADLVAQRKNSK